MPVKESSATALVRYTGLGVFCFNDDRGRGEIAAIRDNNKHSLSIKVQKPAFHDEGGSDLLVYRNIAAYDNLPKDGVEIEIRATRAPAIEGYEIYQHGDFDRLTSADPNDFRWIVNIDAEHAGAALRPAGGGRPYPLTKIYIGNGLFYTHKLDTDLFFEKVQKDAAGRETRREVFGNVAETIGVKIEGAEVEFTIRVGGREETHTLRRIDGLPYRVKIENMDYNENAVYSDMPDYYRYLSSPTGEQFDLSPIIEDAGVRPAGGGAINHKQYCHPVASDLSSIDLL